MKHSGEECEKRSLREERILSSGLKKGGKKDEKKSEPLPISVDPFRDQGGVELETAIEEELKWGRSPEVDHAEDDLCITAGIDWDSDLKEKKSMEPQKRLRINIITKHSRQSQTSANNRLWGMDTGSGSYRSDDFLMGRAAVGGAGAGAGGWFRRRSTRPDFGQGVLRFGVDTTELNRRFHSVQQSADMEGLHEKHEEDHSSMQHLSGVDTDAIQLDCLDSISDVQSFLFSTYSAEMSLKRYERTLQRMTSCIEIRPAPDALAEEQRTESDVMEAACAGVLDYPEEQHMNRQMGDVHGENLHLPAPNMTCRSCGERVGGRVLQHLPRSLLLCSPRCIPDKTSPRDKLYVVSGMRDNRA